MIGILLVFAMTGTFMIFIRRERRMDEQYEYRKYLRRHIDHVEHDYEKHVTTIYYKFPIDEEYVNK